MPKMKTNRSAAKRFKTTASGKIKYKKRGLRHCLEHVSKDTKRNLQKGGILADVETKRIKLMIPYK